MANRTQSRSASSRTSSNRRANRNNDSITAWLGELFGGDDTSSSRSRSSGSSRTSSSRSGSSRSASSSASNGRRTGRKMTRSEAGRAGGLAPHRCRGRECNQRTSRSSSNGRSSY